MGIVFFCILFVFPAIAACLYWKYSTQYRRATPKAAKANDRGQQSALSIEMEAAKVQFAEVMACLTRIEAKVDLLPNKAALSF